MKTIYKIPIICIALFVVSSFMVIVYIEPELFGLTRPYTRMAAYDGVASERELMISEQCLDQKQNPFKDYSFAKTSNGGIYTDNVICERINIQQGGCLEPFSKGYPDETCKNRVTFDYPYGETGPEFNQEFCNDVKSEPSIFYYTEKNNDLYDEYLHICTIRGLIDNSSLPDEDSDTDLIQEIWDYCNYDGPSGQFSYGLEFRNQTHYLDNNNCKWKLISGKVFTGSYELEEVLSLRP